MNTMTPPRTESGMEQFLLRLDAPPLGAVCRLVLGFLILPASSALLGRPATGVTLIAFFLAVLLSVRVVPAVIRKLVRFSAATAAVWAARRQMAKRRDIYQWQKLFWIGLGLVASMSLAARVDRSQVWLAAACLIVGLAGLVSARIGGAAGIAQEPARNGA
jgi:hypothetical protein